MAQPANVPTLTGAYKRVMKIVNDIKDFTRRHMTAGVLTRPRDWRLETQLNIQLIDVEDTVVRRTRQKSKDGPLDDPCRQRDGGKA